MGPFVPVGGPAFALGSAPTSPSGSLSRYRYRV